MNTEDPVFEQLLEFMRANVDFAGNATQTLLDMKATLERIEARLGSIEDALRGPSRN